MLLVDCQAYDHLDTAMQEQSKLAISAARLCSDLEQSWRKIHQSARLTLCLCETSVLENLLIAAKQLVPGKVKVPYTLMRSLQENDREFSGAVTSSLASDSEVSFLSNIAFWPCVCQSTAAALLPKCRI
jgi:hypothetical protein